MWLDAHIPATRQLSVQESAAVGRERHVTPSLTQTLIIGYMGSGFRG